MERLHARVSGCRDQQIRAGLGGYEQLRKIHEHMHLLITKTHDVLTWMKAELSASHTSVSSRSCSDEEGILLLTSKYTTTVQVMSLMCEKGRGVISRAP